jgi:hypothetical protein
MGDTGKARRNLALLEPAVAKRGRPKRGSDETEQPVKRKVGENPAIFCLTALLFEQRLQRRTGPGKSVASDVWVLSQMVDVGQTERTFAGSH